MKPQTRPNSQLGPSSRQGVAKELQGAVYIYIYIYTQTEKANIHLLHIGVYMYICVYYKYTHLGVYLYMHYIRHVPSGTCCVTRSIESSIHSLISTSFQVELGAPGGGGSSSPFLWSFLRGWTRDLLRELRRSLPPSRPPKIQLFRSSAASCALVRQPWRQDVQTSPKRAKTTPSWSTKNSQDSLQDPPEEAPTPEKPPKVP